MKRVMVSRTGAVALILASMMGAGSTARAETSQELSTCALAFCLYENDDFKGEEEEFTFEAYNVCYKALSLGNKASSMRNPSGARVQLYDTTNCTGAYGYAASPHSSDGDLTNNGYDNKASSLKYIKP
jgi:hypothetical protein